MEKDLKRARALLSEKRLKFPVREEEPELSPESIGAIGGIRFVAEDPDATATVYIFEDWPDEEAIVPQLEEQCGTDDEAVYTISGMNGTLLFFGETRLDGPHGEKARRRLNKMRSKFAGNE